MSAHTLEQVIQRIIPVGDALYSMREDPIDQEAVLPGGRVALLSGEVTLGAKNYEFAGVLDESVRLASHEQALGKNREYDFLTGLLVYERKAGINEAPTYSPVGDGDLRTASAVLSQCYPTATVRTLRFATELSTYADTGVQVPLDRHRT